MKHLFIVNPVAGGKSNRSAEVIKTIETLMQSRDEDYEIYITKAPLDACDKIRKSAENGQNLRVYACGGDGTLNECVNAAVGTENISVTHYPCGTGNDFIKMFGDEKELFFNLERLIDGESTKIDIIECNGRYSVNICSVGIDARIGTDVHKYSHLPFMRGKLGYIASLVVNFFRGVVSRMTVNVSGESETGEYALVCACNGRYYGGGFNPVPDARPDDGKIDFLIVGKVTRLKVLAVISKYAKGKYAQLPNLIRHISGDYLEISSDEEIVVNVDGEAIYAKDVYFKMISGGVNFTFPSAMQFFDKSPMKTEGI